MVLELVRQLQQMPGVDRASSPFKQRAILFEISDMSEPL